MEALKFIPEENYPVIDTSIFDPMREAMAGVRKRADGKKEQSRRHYICLGDGIQAFHRS